ncbi:hypothetical protein Fmac_008438 [Flemingia macrophylla]|uniref:Uncharacterized protein n=1 Tax=Flemingia macrophylla TaxID=520843 RepID=A0ABD1MXE9_9FABA
MHTCILSMHSHSMHSSKKKKIQKVYASIRLIQVSCIRVHTHSMYSYHSKTNE